MASVNKVILVGNLGADHDKKNRGKAMVAFFPSLESAMKLVAMQCVFLIALSTTIAHAGFMEGVAAAQKGDYVSAVNEWRPLANQGMALAQYNLGLMYETGRGIAQNQKVAVFWYRKAADQGMAEAQHNLGVMYSAGRGVAQDYQEAVLWYRKAADQGDSIAQYSLSMMYTTGRGIAQDYQEAARWGRKAADQGMAEAQYNLGLMYETGRGVAQNQKLAVLWYQLAAQNPTSDNELKQRAQAKLRRLVK